MAPPLTEEWTTPVTASPRRGRRTRCWATFELSVSGWTRLSWGSPACRSGCLSLKPCQQASADGVSQPTGGALSAFLPTVLAEAPKADIGLYGATPADAPREQRRAWLTTSQIWGSSAGPPLPPEGCPCGADGARGEVTDERGGQGPPHADLGDTSMCVVVSLGSGRQDPGRKQRERRRQVELRDAGHVEGSRRKGA